MLSWIIGEYFYKTDLIKMIEKIDKKRKDKRIKGLNINSTFAQDLINNLNGIEEILESKEEIKKSNSDSSIHYTNKGEDENIKMYIENQFKNS